MIGGSAAAVTLPTILDGGAGNDSLDASAAAGNSILLGGIGTDSLRGGGARDVLIGGAGADMLRGSGDGDVLVGDRVAFEANLAALLSLVEEWQRQDAEYAARASHLRGTAGGLNEPNYLTAATVLEDSAIDQLFGDAGEDLFLARATSRHKDRVLDGFGGEMVIPM
jgi:Ca2+-binding RTX toxin-like protein